MDVRVNVKKGKKCPKRTALEIVRERQDSALEIRNVGRATVMG